jgi:hypothetical protein
VLDDSGLMVLQGQVYGNARELGERIAAGFGLELQYVGPPSPVPAAVDLVEVPPVYENVRFIRNGLGTLSQVKFTWEGAKLLSAEQLD